ncbi:hypothetical protein [Massilia sp. TWR1-2-2]|uniref:hypothetical protein n=1 Tax=Massilia sp. TWR1-2-2 TaxID=2804584 RepID=UPI003CEDF2F5
MFDEAETLAADSTEAKDVAPLPPESEPGKGKPASKPARGKRAPLPSKLQRVDVVHAASAQEQRQRRLPGHAADRQVH